MLWRCLRVLCHVAPAPPAAPGSSTQTLSSVVSVEHLHHNTRLEVSEGSEESGRVGVTVYGEKETSTKRKASSLKNYQQKDGDTCFLSNVAIPPTRISLINNFNYSSFGQTQLGRLSLRVKLPALHRSDELHGRGQPLEVKSKIVYRPKRKRRRTKMRAFSINK